MEAAGKLVCLQKSLETSNLCVLESSQAFISALGCIPVLAAVIQGRWLDWDGLLLGSEDDWFSAQVGSKVRVLTCTVRTKPAKKTPQRSLDLCYI